jgi:hypothetical protein
MTETDRICWQLTHSLHKMAHHLYYLEAATDDELRMAILSILGDLYHQFDSIIPANTELP